MEIFKMKELKSNEKFNIHLKQGRKGSSQRDERIVDRLHISLFASFDFALR